MRRLRLIIYSMNFSPELTGIGKYSGEMAAWLIANPTRRKTFNGMPRFVNGWLAREQNRL